MKDARLYAKFTLDFATNAKILPLSDAAFRCLVEATLWSREHQTDGFLATRLALAKWSPGALEELATNEGDKPSLIVCETGWLIRDFAEHQDTRAEIEARRERNKLNGQKGGLAKGKRSAKQPVSDSVSENLAETETETETLTTSVGPVSRAPRKRGTRLSADWMPPQEVIDAIKAECPAVNLEAEHRKFVDYWTDKTGKDATKLDWTGTWRNWIRRAAETRTQLKVVNGTGSTVDDKVNGWLDLANSSGRELE